MPCRDAKPGAIFLDRDGVINTSPDGRYVTSWRRFQFLRGSLSALCALRKAGWRVIVISNQAGVGRRIMTRRNLRDITRRMVKAVYQKGGRIDAVYYCTHLPGSRCACRKPAIGMLRKAARRFPIDLKRSFVVGDNKTDIAMGKKAGCTTVLVLSGQESKAAQRDSSIVADRMARNLAEAVRWIVKQR